jgi:hypothetical protein
LRCATLTRLHLRRVNAENSNSITLAARQPNIKPVPVDHLDDYAARRNRGGGRSGSGDRTTVLSNHCGRRKAGGGNSDEHEKTPQNSLSFLMLVLGRPT